MCTSLSLTAFAAEEMEIDANVSSSTFVSDEAPKDTEGETSEDIEGEELKDNEGEEPEDTAGRELEDTEGKEPEHNEGKELEDAEGDEPKDTEGDGQPEEEETPSVIQEFLDAVEEVLNFSEVTEDNAEDYWTLYEAAMDTYEKVKSEGLDTDERVIEAMEKLKAKGDEQPKKMKLNAAKAQDAENSNMFEVENMEELADAIATINSSGEGSYKISLKASFTINDAIGDNRLTFGKNDVKRNITLLGNGNTITFATTADINFRVDGKGTVLNLGDGSDSLTIQGDNGVISTAAIFTAFHGSTINMYSNVTLRDFSTFGFTGGGAISLQNATFNMYGGTISNCNALAVPYGGGVIVESGTFNMSGGVIKNCSAFCGTEEEGNVEGYGGGVFLWPDTSFNMSGNSIIKECKSIYGGGVCTFGYFTMSDSAIIINNEADYGGGIYSVDTANVTAIYNNIASKAGADIYSENSANLTLSPVGTDWILNSTSEPITNWYYDGYRDISGEVDESRWKVGDTEEECYLYEYTSPVDGVSVGLKAAHGAAVKQVTITYKDADGNVIGTPETSVIGTEFTVKEALEFTQTKEFDYWSGDDGKNYQPGDKVTPESDLILTAVMKDKANPNPVNPDPEKPDPVNPDPAKPDPVKPNPAKTDLVKVDPVNPSNASDNITTVIDIPKTGDTFNQMLLVMPLLSCCSLAAIIFLIKKSKKWQQEL